MKIGAMNHPARNPLEEIDWFGRHGFDFVDFTLEPPAADPDQIDLGAVRAALERYGLGVVAHTAWFLPFSFPFTSIRQASLVEFRRALRAAHRRVSALLHHALDLRDRHAAGQLSAHGLAVCRGRLSNQLLDAIYPPKTYPANERLAHHLWKHYDDLLTFLKHPGLDATNWRAELAIRFGVILRKVWGGSRTWAGARAQSVLMSVWRTCWQQGRSALDFLSQLMRGTPVALALPP